MRGALTRAAALAALTFLLTADAAAAQEKFSVGGTVGGVRVVRRGGPAAQSSTGMEYGGRMRGRFGPFAVGVGYLEGTTEAEGTGIEGSFIHGEAFAALRITRWLDVGASMRVNRMDETGPERWVLWGAVARLDLPLVGKAVHGHFTYDQSVGGEVNLPDGAVRAQRAEVGITFRPRDQPLAMELATRVDATHSGERSRTLQHLALTMSLELR